MKVQLTEWFGAARKTYNACVKESHKDYNQGLFANKFNIRAMISAEKTTKDPTFEKEFRLERSGPIELGTSGTPSVIRKAAVDEFVTRWNTSIEIKRMKDFKLSKHLQYNPDSKAKPTEPSKFEFKKKKSHNQTIGLEKSAFGPNPFKVTYGKKERPTINITIFKNISNKHKNCHFIAKGKKSLQVLESWSKNRKDPSISFDGVNYWFNLPFDASPTPTVEPTDRVVGIDPGIRSIVTCYSPSEVFDYKTNRKKIFREFDKLDQIASEYGNNSIQYLKKSGKLTQRMKSYHTLIAKNLVKHNDTIIMGQFDSQKLTYKGGPNKKDFNRETSHMSHFKFRSRVELECVKSGKNFITVKEHYTSKTCGGCGWVNHELGASKDFNCSQCRVIMDRDANAARNMIAKLLLWVR